MADLTTQYMGLHLNNPLVPAASPLSRNLDHIKRMEDAGAGAVVLHSLFEEQLTEDSASVDDYLLEGDESYSEARRYFPKANEFAQTPAQYLEHIHAAKRSVSIPIIASLNGVSAGYWTQYAREIEQAGADALELNVYFIPTSPWLTSDGIEQMHLDLLRDVRSMIHIPIAVKLSPYFTNLASMAYYLSQAGADALVLFNRFYQPDIDLNTLKLISRPHLSTSLEPQALLLPLRWIGILYGWLPLDLAASSGIHTVQDVVKILLVGGSITTLASELLINGIERLHMLRTELAQWMDDHEYATLDQVRGTLSHRHVAFPAAFERAHYMRALASFNPRQNLRI